MTDEKNNGEASNETKIEHADTVNVGEAAGEKSDPKPQAEDQGTGAGDAGTQAE